MNSNRHRPARTLEEQAQARAIEAVPVLTAYVSPETGEQWAANAETQHLLDEAAAGRIRVGAIYRLCRTREDVEAEGFPVRDPTR